VGVAAGAARVLGQVRSLTPLFILRWCLPPVVHRLLLLFDVSAAAALSRAHGSRAIFSVFVCFAFSLDRCGRWPSASFRFSVAGAVGRAGLVDHRGPCITA